MSYNPHPSTINSLCTVIAKLKAITEDASKGGADAKVISKLSEAFKVCNEADEMLLEIHIPFADRSN